MLDKLEELAKFAQGKEWARLHNGQSRIPVEAETILRLVRAARAAKVILSHHDEGARPDQIALDELRAALKETT
jgi:hypothetical protein